MKVRGIPVAVMLVIALALGVAGCAQTASPTAPPAANTGGAKLANPASVYCQQQGYTVQMRTDQTGNQYGICVLGTNAECDEWAFFRHECGPLPGSASTAVTVTQVITYVPGLPAGAEQQGTCMGSSLAVWRADVWRCTADNSIQDPCFSQPGGGDSLICGGDPTTGAPGVLLKLAQPLPKPDAPQDATTHAWLIELADGTVCGYATGATGGVGDKRMNYLCRSTDPSKRVAILGDLQPGTVWTADKGLVVTGDQGPTIKETTKTPIRRLWR